MKRKISIAILLFACIVVAGIVIILYPEDSQTELIQTDNKYETVKLPRKTEIEELEAYTSWNYKKDDIEITVYRNGEHQSNTIIVKNQQNHYICPLYRSYTGKTPDYVLPVENDRMMYQQQIIFDNPRNSVNTYMYANENSIGISFVDKDERIGDETEIELKREKDSMPKLAVTSYLRYFEEKYNSNYLSEAYYWEQISGDNQEGEVKLYGKSTEARTMDSEWSKVFSVKKEKDIYVVYLNNKKVYEYRNELLPVTTVKLGESKENDISSSANMLLLAIESYIEYCSSNPDSELNKVNDIGYSHTLGNNELGTVRVHGKISDEEKFSKDYRIKKEQKAYQIMDEGVPFFEYMPDENYIHKIIKDYFANVKEKEIEGELSYQYDMGKKAEKVTLTYEDSGKKIQENYYVKVYEDSETVILYDKDYQPIYSQE